METQVETQTEVLPGVGDWQSKLATLMHVNEKAVVSKFLFSRKRRDPYTEALHIGCQTQNALRESVLLMVKCLEKHEDREDFAKTMFERLSK